MIGSMRTYMTRSFWSGLGFTILYTIAFIIWLIIKPGPSSVFNATDDWACVVGPAIMVLFCADSLMKAWRAMHSRQVVEASLKLQFWSSIFLSLSTVCSTVAQFFWAYYADVLHISPYPSWADVYFLLAYPLLMAGIVLLPTRALPRSARTRALLDSLTIMTAVITFSWFFVLGPIIRMGGASPLVSFVETAYPVGDIALISCLLILSFRSCASSLRPVIYMLAFSLVMTALTDSFFDYQVLHGTYATGEIIDWIWPSAYMLTALVVNMLCNNVCRLDALTQEVSDSTSREGVTERPSFWRTLLPYVLVPAIVALLIFAWQTNDAFLVIGVTTGAIVIMALIFLRQVIALRETIAYAENTRRLNEALKEANEHLALATTDTLTGLPNHRALITALDHEFERSYRYDHSFSVLFFDLDHFKALNDGYGHAIGDAVLREFSTLIKPAFRTVDIVGRWSGEEFFAILPETGIEGAMVVAERIRAMVADHVFHEGGGVRMTCSLGVAAYPDDAQERDELVAAVEQAMSAAKRLGRNQARTLNDPLVQALENETSKSSFLQDAAVAGIVEALTGLVEARDRYTGKHTLRVGSLTLQLALMLGMDTSEAHMIGLAGQLHDIGKVGIPDSVLLKPAKLTEEEWEIMRTHPAIGADIVSRIPVLKALAPVVRAHHERWDGNGYPDKLAGEDIPLGARIIAVVDSYEAMTTDRPYQKARDEAWAINELRRCAGSQFDADVVEALEKVLEAQKTEANTSDTKIASMI